MDNRLRLAHLKRQLHRDLLSAGVAADDCGHEVDLIIEEATGWKLAAQVLNENESVSEVAAQKIAELSACRQKRVPLQYCLGYTHFRGLKLAVRPGVLIPRADTEILVEVFLARLPAGSVRVAEIGTGSGAVSIAVLNLRPEVQVAGIDISPTAIEVTRENALVHQVSARLQLLTGDWQEVLPYDLDAVVANPPYIPLSQAADLQPEVVRFEPPEALFGGDDDGLAFYRRFSRQGLRHLRAGGLLCLEVGAGQAAAVVRMFRESGWRELEVTSDLSGIARVVSAVAPNQGFANS